MNKMKSAESKKSTNELDGLILAEFPDFANKPKPSPYKILKVNFLTLFPTVSSSLEIALP
jgi:hypothetical protein